LWVAAPHGLPVGAAVLATHPADHPSPGVFLQVAEGRLGRRVPEVGGPAAQHLRRGHYELGHDTEPGRRLEAIFTELALVV
jgi:hypothetical protein